MKALVPISLVLAGGLAFGQYRGIRPQPYGSVTGFGSVLYPGLGHAPLQGRGGGSIMFPSGLGGGIWNGRGGGPGGKGGGRTAVVPYPVFVGGYGYAYDAEQVQQQQQAPQTIVVQPQAPAAAPAPNITINQYFRSDGTPEGAPDVQAHAGNAVINPPSPAARRSVAPPAEEKPTIYLIAFKDQTIMPALGYWIEGDTLSYITRDGTPNRVSLALVDRDFSRQLNTERQVEFSLP